MGREHQKLEIERQHIENTLNALSSTSDTDAVRARVRADRFGERPLARRCVDHVEVAT